MDKLLSMEWLKLRTRPLPWALYGTVLVFTTLFFFIAYLFTQSFTGRAGSQASTTMDNLQLPGAIYSVITSAAGLSALGLSVVAAIMAGQEFSLGTVRMLLVRGPGRLRLWLGKALLLLIFALIVSLINALLGFILGSIVDAATSYQQPFNLAEMLQGTLQLVSASTLHLWTYALLALLVATLFRSPVAGVGVTLVLRVVELIIGPLLGLALLSGNDLLKFIGQLNYFLIGNNVDALYRYAAPTGWTGRNSNVSFSAFFTISGTQAGIYMLVAPLLFLGLTLYLMRSRDVTS